MFFLKQLLFRSDSKRVYISCKSVNSGVTCKCLYMIQKNIIMYHKKLEISKVGIIEKKDGHTDKLIEIYLQYYLLWKLFKKVTFLMGMKNIIRSPNMIRMKEMHNSIEMTFLLSIERVEEKKL